MSSNIQTMKLLNEKQKVLDPVQTRNGKRKE